MWWECFCQCHIEGSDEPVAEHCEPCCNRCELCQTNVAGDFDSHIRDEHPAQAAILLAEKGFSKIGSFHNGVAWAEKNGLWSQIFSDGTLAPGGDHDLTLTFSSEDSGGASFYKDGTWLPMGTCWWF